MKRATAPPRELKVSPGCNCRVPLPICLKRDVCIQEISCRWKRHLAACHPQSPSSRLIAAPPQPWQEGAQVEPWLLSSARLAPGIKYSFYMFISWVNGANAHDENAPPACDCARDEATVLSLDKQMRWTRPFLLLRLEATHAFHVYLKSSGLTRRHVFTTFVQTLVWNVQILRHFPSRCNQQFSLGTEEVHSEVVWLSWVTRTRLLEDDRETLKCSSPPWLAWTSKSNFTTLCFHSQLAKTSTVLQIKVNVVTSKCRDKAIHPLSRPF